MRSVIKCITVPTERHTCVLIIDCDINCSDVIVKDSNRFISIECHNVSINEETSSKNYKEFFNVTSDGDYHILIEFKKVPKDLRIKSLHDASLSSDWTIVIQGV